MATEKQIAQNQLNALLSTGTGNPLVSRLNPSKHNLTGSIIFRPGEKEEDYHACIIDSIGFYEPRTLQERHDAVLKAQLMWGERRVPQAIQMAELEYNPIDELNKVIRYANGLARYIDRIHKRIVESKKYRPSPENDKPFDITPYLKMKFPIVRLDRLDRVKYPYHEEEPVSRVQKRHQHQIERLKESYRQTAEQKAQAEIEWVTSPDASHEYTSLQGYEGQMESGQQANVPLPWQEELEEENQNTAENTPQAESAQETFQTFLNTFAMALRGKMPEASSPSGPTDPQAGEDSLPGAEGKDSPINPRPLAGEGEPVKPPPGKSKKAEKAQRKKKRKNRLKQKRKHRH